MKAPLSWLKDYVDIDCSPEELQSKLFSCGFEVEEMIYVAKNIEKIVVCQINKIEKHPNADKLSVCQINAGAYGKLQIVTNAKNITEGDLVPVALDGATLADGNRIFNGELRGVKSNGMFCSGEELGINDDVYEGASTHGILILREEYPLGAEVKKVLDLEDVIFDIGVTANRPDCQSILGIAREVAAVLNKPLKMPDLSYTVNEKLSTKDKLVVENNATDLCPRYIGHYVSDIQINKSPKWLTKRLNSVGIRGINNIVDITNFVLTELGQPMHAFDYSNIGGNKIVIRRAENGEKITTLDNKEFVLCDKNLVICDASKPIALAGIMGGLNSEIKETTKDIVFESAKFLRDNIRKSSRTLGQKSDSSSRYEKGVDAYTTGIAIKRALNLIDTLKCGTIACDCYDLPTYSDEKHVINTTISKINGVLGIEISKETIKNILEKLFFEVNINNDEIVVTVPQFREDVESYQDLAEEVIREYGYDNINGTLLKNANITVGGYNNEQLDINNLKDFMCQCGYNEIITYSFVSTKDFENYKLPTDNTVKILNPLGEDLSVMRTSLIPSMVNVIAKNLNRKNLNGKLFEFARTYTLDKELVGNNLPTEKGHLSIGAFGDDVDFFTVKGILTAIADTFLNGKEFSYKRSNKSFYHPTISADVIYNGVEIASIGALNPVLAEKLGIDKRIFVGEINYTELKKLFDKNIKYKAISKFPTVERDLALILDDEILCGDVIEIIKENAGEFLTNVKLFDIYKGNQIAEGKKSLAFNLIYSSLTRTLTVEEIDASVKDILNALKDKFNAELR